MKYFAVIDTNVLVSAMLNWESNPGSVMELTFAGVIVPLINDDIVAEYRQVLSRPKFCLTEVIIEAVVSEVEKQGILVYIDDTTFPQAFRRFLPLRELSDCGASSSGYVKNQLALILSRGIDFFVNPPGKETNYVLDITCLSDSSA